MISNSNIISIQVEKKKTTLTPAQKKFNAITKAIDKAKKRLVCLKDIAPKYQSEYLTSLLPLQKEISTLRIEMIKLLDKMHDTSTFNKTERKKLANIIRSLLEGSLDPSGSNGLKEIYNKYYDDDFDQTMKDQKQEIIDQVHDELDIDLGDAEFNSAEDLMEELLKKAKEKKEKAEKKPPKKSAKTLAKEKRLKVEAEEISQSIKEIHRKLAMQLHPDKEQDAAERKRKTLLMQRVNMAYKAKDLLQLIEIQIEVEQLDKESIATLSEARLKTYNKILHDQLISIERELVHGELSFKMRFKISSLLFINPIHLMRDLKCQVAETQDELAILSNDLELFKDPKALKKWLKKYGKQMVSFEDLEMFF